MLKHLTIAGITALAFLMAIGAAFAAPCVIAPGTPLIRHDLTAIPSSSNSYCELCGTGSITVIISNPYGDDTFPYNDVTNMHDLTVVEDLGSSGLTYAGTTEAWVNGSSVTASGPVVTGGNSQILTWDSNRIGDLLLLAGDPDPSDVTNITIRFSVESNTPTFDEEDLVGANRTITASLTYTPRDGLGTDCLPSPGTATPPPVTDTLPLREPEPAVTKGGRNVDAGQGSYTATAYGNDDDDIIWRVRIINGGDADLQDLGLDDVMQSGNLDINYICPSEAAAEQIAITNNGAGPGTMGCQSVSGNSVDDFDVDDPFGEPPTGVVDVSQRGNTDIFFVGKVPTSNNGSGTGACSAPRTNTVSDIHWGCESDGPDNPGGLTATSTGSSPGSASAILSTLSDYNLDYAVAYIGYPGNAVAGARGRVQITITNNTGGSVNNLWLRNDLPPEYVVDATHPVTIDATGAYGGYPGLTNRINWDNENTTDPLLNNVPEFTLTSSAATNDGHANLLRNGDQLVITFGIILIRPQSYDEQADLDVVIESPTDGTDPDHATDLNNLRNTLDVRFDNFCTGGTTTETIPTDHTPVPEDLDVQFSGGELVFILTGDITQRLPLTVDLINRGGHDAEDYTAYVAFGQTMNVVTVPGGCSPTSAPRTFEEWQDPSGYPAGAAIYACTGGAITPGATRSFDFEVVKSLVPSRVQADDLTFRADVFGEITDFAGNLLTYPDINVLPRGDSGSVRANNYTLDALRARVVGFNLLKAQEGNCSEDNNPLPPLPDRFVQIGEECTYRIDTGGWFGFQTPGWTFISVQDIELVDQLPDGQGWLRSGDSAAPSTTPAIDGVRRSPALTPLDEGWITWNFNDPAHATDPGPPITVADHWFRREMTTRFLNDPIDTSALPNNHGAGSTNTLSSTFWATFEDSISGTILTTELGPSTIGYPIVSVRQITMDITEPELTVVKEVCNETLYGSGPTCSNWVSLADDGDALNDYIYRLTVTNELTSGGFTRAPAYDVTVTDTLDTSDLAYVLPFASDGLNNDGDSATDGADAGGEGSIINNEIPPNGTTPAVITFSSTHSSALLRINPGDSVQLYYRVDFDDDAAPLQTFTNGAYATYDSLEWTDAQGDSGMQTAPLRPNGDIGGARVYTSPTANADVRIIPIETQPKRIVDLSNTALAGSGTQGISIGEEIEYRLNTLLPVALLRNFVIRDELPTGITCEEAPNVDLGPSGPHAAAGFTPGGVITPTCNDTLVEWNFGDQRVTAGTAGLGNRYDFEIGFIARVANTAGNNDGDTIANGGSATNAFARYVDEVGTTITQEFDQLDVQVREPLIALTKDFGVANADAADVLTITVTATNNGTATAYNLGVMDDLTGSYLTYLGNVGGSNPPVVDTSEVNRPIFSWSAPNGIDPGDAISFTFEVLVDSTVEPQQILANTIQAKWTSLQDRTTALINGGAGPIGIDGDPDGMRIGILPNSDPADSLNDYETTASDDVAVPAVVLTKTDLNPTVVPAIGARKEFQIEIALPEGVTNDLVVTDTLDSTGLSYILENDALDISYNFRGIATINGSASLVEGNWIAFPADETSGSAVWNFGTVVTQTENDTAASAVNPLIRITYYARINNDQFTDAGDPLQNSVEANYTHGQSGATVSLVDTTPVVTVVEPRLALSKTVTKIAGDNLTGPVEGGDTLRYALTFTASGGGAGDDFSDAYDLIIEDTLSVGLQYILGSAEASSGGTTTPLVDPFSNASGTFLRWSPTEVDIDIAEGTVVTITYNVWVHDGSISPYPPVSPGDLLENSARAQWTSLDGDIAVERDGTDATWLQPTPTPHIDDYFTGPVSTQVVVGDDSSATKTRNSDTYGANGDDDQVRIGDLITYQLQFTMLAVLLEDAFVVDTLPRGLQFEDIIEINGESTAPYVAVAPFGHLPIDPAVHVSVSPSVGAAATGPTTLRINLGGDLTKSSGAGVAATFTIIYRARVLNNDVHPQVDNIDLTNSAAMGYTFDSTPPATVVTTLNSEYTVAVRQPNLAVAKSATAEFGDTVLQSGEWVDYTVEITNNGTAPAYDTVLHDILPVGMLIGAPHITMVSTRLYNGATLVANLTDITPTFDPATGIATWDFDNGTADAYTIPPGNTLQIVYRVFADDTLGPGMTLTNQAQVQLYYSFDDDDPPSGDPGRVDEREEYGSSNTASVTFTTDAPGIDSLTKENPAVLTAAIGQPFTYRITVPTTPQATALNDVRIIDDLGASAADLTFIRVTTPTLPAPAWTPVNTGTATSLVIEDTTNGIDIPAGEQAVVEITVMLADTATNVSGLDFNNTASYTYNQVNDNDAFQQVGGADTTPNMTIVGPDTLIMNKSGPANMSVGTPGAFVLDLFNNSSGAAWNPTIVDQLPDDATNGGTCGAGPSNITVQYFDNASPPNPIPPVLTAGTHYTVTFDAGTCSWTLQLLSVAGPLEPNEHLVVNYETTLDADSLNGTPLTNVAGATQWYSYDPDDADAAPRTYTRTITDGTVGVDDHEDAHTANTEAPVLSFVKNVRNVSTGQDPGLNAVPGNTLHYTLEVTNTGPAGIADFSIVDEVDALNSPALFVPGSLVVTNAGGGVDATTPLGGTNGTGVVNITNLSIDAAGGANDTVVVEFEVTLVPVITSGTVVLNQAELVWANPTNLLSDDPNVGGSADPTETLISSQFNFQVQKISTDLTDDPAVLMAGDTLRYTLTIKNIGDENAINTRLRDLTPANTAYVANSTTLNGAAVPDTTPGVCPLETGILINAPEDPTPGAMRADTDPGADNVATVTFDVVVDPAAMDGLIIENQGFVSSEGTGSGSQPEQPSDDPDTAAPDDPTRDVVGNVPLLYAHKTVALSVDINGNGFVDPGDELRYTIDIRNTGAIPATGVTLTDAVPVFTTYVANSIRLNGAALPPDGGVSPLIAGLALRSSDNPGAGIISAGESAVVIFDVTVNFGAPNGALISNQGDLTSNELPPGLTDADGLPANGYQPTVIVVGNAQLLTITKEVAVVGGGAALAGSELAYTVRVTNPGSVPATQLVITDDLGPPMDVQVTYVPGSGTLDGLAAGVSYAGDMITADYATTYGDLAPGSTCTLRFRVQISATIAIGTTITNTGVVNWNSPAQTDSASVSIDVGGTPGSAVVNGNAWHDANLDVIRDSGEQFLAGWTVALYRNGAVAVTTTTDASGIYQFSGLVPNDTTTDQYTLRFTSLGGGVNAAALGYADSVFTDGPHRISDIVVGSGANLQNLNLPIQPNGTVYNSVLRTPVSGATLTLQNAATGAAVSNLCFDDPNQQNQVTADEGFYNFDMNFSQSSCPADGDYLIAVTAPATGYRAAPSQIIPPESDASTAAFVVPTCPGSAADAVPATAGYCESVIHPAVPPVSVPPRTAGTRYYLHLQLSNGAMPGESQIYNNPIPIDPEMAGAAAITKTVSKTSVTRGTLVPYTITVTNTMGAPLYDVTITDRFPAGFKYVAGSARLNSVATEPTIAGRELVWDGLELQVDAQITIKLLLVVGGGVSEGEYVNRAQVSNSAIGDTISGEATATVRVIPDPDFDCTDIIGKVFDDANLDGQQDAGEQGLAGVRVVTVRGLIATTDAHGRFHITCAAVPDQDRGSNFILKLDERSLPTGYRLTTENPRVQRATRGKMMRFNFGATIHSVVRIDIADGAFEPKTTELRPQWTGKIEQLLEALRRGPSVLRLAYLGDVEPKALVQRRLETIKKQIKKQWKKNDGGYPLTIETEIFWRRGASFHKR